MVGCTATWDFRTLASFLMYQKTQWIRPMIGLKLGWGCKVHFSLCFLKPDMKLEGSFSFSATFF